MEDSEGIQDLCWQALVKGVGFPQEDILQAYTIGEAKGLFKTNSADIAIIFFDGKLGEKTSIKLVKEIRQKFDGVMVAASSDINDELIAAGCTKTWAKNPMADFVSMVVEATGWVKKKKILAIESCSPASREAMLRAFEVEAERIGVDLILPQRLGKEFDAENVVAVVQMSRIDGVILSGFTIIEDQWLFAIFTRLQEEKIPVLVVSEDGPWIKRIAEAGCPEDFRMHDKSKALERFKALLTTQ
ncbi:MAG: hypothetical protein PHS53_03640 [Candidatus Pacebacteria bacterium]|nr:hypothetical protein [Candidatus Paceibacterota bacterium]